MKIAYVLNTYPQPSHSFIRREIRALEALGHEVLRLPMRRAAGPLADVQDQQEQARSEYVLEAGKGALARAVWTCLRRDPRSWVRATRAAWQMGGASETGRLRHLIYLAEACQVALRCRAEGVGHVHAHFGTNAAAVATLSHLLGGPKFSFTVHGPEEFDSPRALSLGAKMASADFTVAISQFGRSQLKRWAAPQDWQRIRIVHCGIEPDRFGKVVALPPGQRRVVSIGRFVEQKGQLDLVAAMAGLKDVDLHLTLIGDGEMRPQIEALIVRHGLDDRISLTGWVDEARVNAELAAAHALVMPSFAEGLPMVVMEAMATARPVIATYIAGTPELVQPGVTGWLVPAGDTAALSDALRALVATPLPELAAMGTAGRARVFERHDVALEAAKLAGFMQGN